MEQTILEEPTNIKKQNKWETHISAILQRARSDNIYFDLTTDDLEKKYIDQNGLCALTGKKLTIAEYRDTKHCNASVDRKDPKKGYIYNNIQWVLKIINRIKQQCDNNQIIEISNLISNYNNDKRNTTDTRLCNDSR